MKGPYQKVEPLYQLPTSAPTHQQLIAMADKWLTNTVGCAFTLLEVRNSSDEIPDAIGWTIDTYGRELASHMVECIACRSGFRYDCNSKIHHKQFKAHRIFPLIGMGNYRYYMCAPGLIKENEIPQSWGLLYAYSKQVRVIRRPIKLDDPRVAVNDARILCAALRKAKLAGALDSIYSNSKVYGNGKK